MNEYLVELGIWRIRVCILGYKVHRWSILVIVQHKAKIRRVRWPRRLPFGVLCVRRFRVRVGCYVGVRAGVVTREVAVGPSIASAVCFTLGHRVLPLTFTFGIRGLGIGRGAAVVC